MLRILVIDDNAAIRRLVAHIFKGEFEVLEAEDGRSGLQLAQRHLPALVLCDLSLPDIDGYEVLETLHRDESTRSIEFVFISATYDYAMMRRGMTLGADDYVVKPFTASELRQSVEARLKKKMQREAGYKRLIEELQHNIIMALPHELRTAIMVIEGYLHLLLEDSHNLTPEQEEMLKALNTSALRLHSLAEKFLWYTRSQILPNEEHPMSMTNSPHDLIEWVALNAAKQYKRLNDLELELETAHIALPEEALAKIIEELVENAFKFSKPGTAVYIRAAVHGQFYAISVLDHGRGMNAEHIAKVGGFMQFNRSIHEQQGAGLGLIIAKSLTELLGGKFAIESNPGQGTVLFVNLPYEPTSTLNDTQPSRDLSLIVRA